MRMQKRLAVVIGGMLCMSMTLSAQSDALYSHYWAMPSYYNPAAAGTTDKMRVRGATRMDWVGIHNAPKSFAATGDTPFSLGGVNVGLGLRLSQESAGLFSDTELGAQGSYGIKMGKGRVTFGLQVGLHTSKFRGSEVELPDGDDFHQGVDEAIPTQDVAGNALSIGAGLRYTHPRFSVGVSAMNFNAPTVSLKDPNGNDENLSSYEVAVPARCYFDVTGNIELKNTLIELYPSLILSTNFRSLQGEVTMRGRYNRFLSAGVGYRYREALTLTLGAEIKDIVVGYGFSYPLSMLARVSGGSHELVLGYSFKLDFGGQNRNRQRSIRFM